MEQEKKFGEVIYRYASNKHPFILKAHSLHGQKRIKVPAMKRHVVNQKFNNHPKPA